MGGSFQLPCSVRNARTLRRADYDKSSSYDADEILISPRTDSICMICLLVVKDVASAANQRDGRVRAHFGFGNKLSRIDFVR